MTLTRFFVKLLAFFFIIIFFRKEKKRVEKELLSTFKDESIIVLADWLKVIFYQYFLIKN